MIFFKIEKGLIKSICNWRYEYFIYCIKVCVHDCIRTRSERPRTEKELTNRNGQMAELFKCDWLILSPSKISDQVLTSWTQALTHLFKKHLCGICKLLKIIKNY